MGDWDHKITAPRTKPSHVHDTPFWGKDLGDVLEGSIWKCDCGQKFKLRFTYGSGSDQGMQMNNWDEVA